MRRPKYTDTWGSALVNLSRSPSLTFKCEPFQQLENCQEAIGRRQLHIRPNLKVFIRPPLSHRLCVKSCQRDLSQYFPLLLCGNGYLLCVLAAVLCVPQHTPPKKKKKLRFAFFTRPRGRFLSVFFKFRMCRYEGEGPC